MENYLPQITDYLLTQSWQIAILVAVMAAVTMVLNNKSAHIRYLLWLIVLAKCLVPPLLTVPLAVLPQEKLSEPVPVFPAQMPAISYKAVGAPATEAAVPPASPAPNVVEEPPKLTVHQWLGLGWITGVAVFVLFVVIKSLRTNFGLRRQRKPLPAELQSQIEDLFFGLGFKTLSKLWLVEGVGQPFVWGLLRGNIYLPADFVKVDCSEHRRVILGHELSHVLRFDAAVNILQIIAQAMFWFHPFVWWANKKIRAEREKCCDEIAIARFGGKAKDYSDAIVNILISEHESVRPVPSLAVAGPVKNIEERIKTMLRPGKKFYKHPSLVAATFVLLLALLTVPTALVLTARAGTQTETTSPARGEAVAISTAPATRHAQQTGLVVREVEIQQGESGLSLSRDGKKLVYPRRKDGKTNLVVRDLASGEETQITNYETGLARNPVFSPNRKEVVYTHTLDLRTHHLHIVSLETGEDHRLDQDGFAFDWSRDGRFLLLWGNRVLPAGGGSVKQLNLPPGSGAGRFSPDGKYVTYVSPRGKPKIYLYPVSGGDPIQITHGSRDTNPRWSPDGKMLLFLSQRAFGPEMDLCGVSVVDGKAAGDVQVIKPDFGDNIRLHQLSETGRLLFRRSHTESHVYVIPIDLQTGQSTGEPVRLAAGYVTMWSPDAKRIAYFSGGALHVMSADGSNDKEIIQVFPFKGTHAWAADNNHIYVAESSRAAKTGKGVYSISIATKERRPVYLDRDMLGHLSCSPDGKRLAFIKILEASKKSEIFTVGVDGTNLEQLTSNEDASVNYPAWSPDGKQIAFESGPRGGIKTLTVVSVDDGTSREVFRGKTPQDRFLEPSWSPDGSKIAWSTYTLGRIRIGQVSDGKYETFNVDLGLSPKPTLSMPRWSPDGSKMLFSTYSNIQHLMVMDNFLPAAVASAKTQ